MYQLTRMRVSRDGWKDKARERAEQLREARKSHHRQKERIKALEEENETLKKREPTL